MLSDLRALGGSAPLRAAYEMSKRSGFHGVLFRGARRDGRRHHASVPLTFGTRVPASASARERCLEDARLIAGSGTRVFGVGHVPTGVHASWSTDPLSGREWPAHQPWWRIDIRSQERLSDVKYVWEAARHRDLVVLARAAELDLEGPWLDTLAAAIASWLGECRPEQGVNWYSSLELALRAVAWSQVLGLVGHRLPPEVRRGMDAQLVASARHIMVELPYTVSSMKNNHLLGDGLGLVVLGHLFPTHPASGRWSRIGDALMVRQLARHMRPDGSMIEDTLSYHRFVLEMLIVRQLLPDVPRDVSQAMAAAAENLRQLGALDGDVPQFGDWDEGRVLTDSAPAGSVAGSGWAALALAGARVPDRVYDEHDEVAWYTAVGQSPAFDLSPLARVRDAGYFQVVEQGRWSVWFKTRTGPSHQHADLTSVWIRDGDRWIVEDPGTGTYNGPLDVRNGFRTSAAHPVWRPRGEDQLQPHRAFRWLGSARLHAAPPEVVDDGVVLMAWHDAFETSHGRVARVIRVSSVGVTVDDLVERPGVAWVMTVPLGPRARADELTGLRRVSTVRGQTAPFAGWRSTTYGSWEPSTWLETEGNDGKVTWSVGEVDDRPIEVTWGEDVVRCAAAGLPDGMVARRG